MRFFTSQFKLTVLVVQIFIPPCHRIQSEYEAYLADERQFLRSLGLYDDIDAAAGEAEAAPA